MTYYESAKGLRITRTRAAAEIRRHQCEPADFFAEAGEPGSDGLYLATDVLDWLGY